MMNPLKTSALLLLAAALTLTAMPALAHCDPEDGPVVANARIALASGEVGPVLKWIGPDDEATIRALFEQVVTVRKAGGDAESVADRLFFETLIRLHRAGEGAPFEGIAPAGNQPPYVVTIDRAIAAGHGSEVAAKIGGVVSRESATRFEAVANARASKDESPDAGRAYVAAYVELVHFIKGIHEAVEAGGAHSHAEAPAAHHAHGGAN